MLLGDIVVVVLLVSGCVFELFESCWFVKCYGVKLIVIIVLVLLFVKFVDYLILVVVFEIDFIYKLLILCYVMMMVIDVFVIGVVLWFGDVGWELLCCIKYVFDVYCGGGDC